MTAIEEERVEELLGLMELLELMDSFLRTLADIRALPEV